MPIFGDNMNFWNIMMCEIVMMMTLSMDMCVEYWWYNGQDLLKFELRMMNGFLREILLKYVCFRVHWCRDS